MNFMIPLLADKNASYFFPIQGSTFAEEVDNMYFFIQWICIIFFIPMMWALFYFAIRYHRKKGESASSRATHHTLLELGWSIGPSILLVLIFVRGTWAFLDMREAPADAYVVEATAQKWSWSFQYPGGIVSPELHVVKDQPTKVNMRSKDVLHALFIPAFRAKQDVVPGRYGMLWFHPTVANSKVSEGELTQAIEMFKGKKFDYRQVGFTDTGYTYYDLFCAEYCGQDHSQMQTVCVVHENQEDFNEWLVKANVRPSGMSEEEYGGKMYEQRGCISCHSLDGANRAGPSFKGSFETERSFADGSSGKMDDNYIRESILNPRAKVVKGFQPVMPTFKGQLTDEQIHCLIQFIKSKK
jgi:cytochrome c oxidase subunit 2